MPVTVLSGFLGSGKTSCLQHLLSNSEGLKIAVVVNDVAAVNIDSKLVRGTTVTAGGAGGDAETESGSTPPAGIVELQNGCACCSQDGELLSAVSELISLSDLRQEEERFDHIVVEMSGVAEPRSVRNMFQEAMMYDMPLLERVSLDTLVTIVDCSTYLDYMRSRKLANLDESPELFYRDEAERKKAEEEEDESWMAGMPPILVGALSGVGGASGDEGGVCDLLVEQTEVADIILLNKVDLVPGKLEDTQQLVAALNPRAKIIPTSFGKVEKLNDILAFCNGEGVALDGVVDDHKEYVVAAEAKQEPKPADCADPDCTDTSHDHAHSHHEHTVTGLPEDAGCADSDCTDTSHDHAHSHRDHAAAGSPEDAGCADADCTDTSHSHAHGHSHAATHAGIGSYVYRARRPFEPSRLVSILRNLPVIRGVPSGVSGDTNDTEEHVKEVFQKVLRSKGFAWTADSNVKALYWSHAGSSFEMQCLGRWWATLPRQQWPEEAKESILADFDVLEHDDAAASPATSTVGDRRQEVVFIGPGLASSGAQAVIQAALNACLLNDEEWDVYRAERHDEASLTHFENPLETRMLTY